MGIFDTIKSRLNGGDTDEYAEEYADERYEEENYQDDAYYGDSEYAEEEYGEEYQDEEHFGGSGDEAVGASVRKSSVFNNYTPLVSMSDVRSQELPAYTPAPSTTRARHSAGARQDGISHIRTSLPFVGNPADSLESGYDKPSSSSGDSYGSAEHHNIAVYEEGYSSDTLLQRHSLSNTGDFAATSPAYYASRSGVGHVRPIGEVRKVTKKRETIVVVPQAYAEAEQVAVNLRNKNAVVLVLSRTRPELAKRILDFSFGAAAAVEGQVTSIGERVYALTCDYALTETELELLHAKGTI